MNIVFFGASEFAVPSLEILSGPSPAFNIKAVVTRPDRPKGRGLVLSHPPVARAAEKFSLPVFQPEKVSTPGFISLLASFSPELFVVVSFGEIFSKEFLNLPRLGSINLHASLLPRYRGASPVAQAIMNGEKETGVSTFWISEKMDSGDIILQRKTEILPDDSKGTLEDRLSHAGAELLLDTLSRVNNNTAPRIPQNDSAATYSSKIKKTNGLIDWTKPADCLRDMIRAMNPWPAAYTFLDSRRIEIWQALVFGEKTEAVPGEVVFTDKNGIGVATGKGILVLQELQAEGRHRVKATDFVNGYRVKIGQVFG